jgi:hypothetical protein
MSRTFAVAHPGRVRFAQRVLCSLNYDAMKRLNVITCAALIVLAAHLSGCSVPEENSGSSNTNATHQANSNAASQPQIALGNSNVPAVQPIPAPPIAENPSGAANANAAIAPASAAGNARAPKLVVSTKKIDFGKQPQDKTLVRAIVVKNGGREDLKIESVVPS